MIKEKQHNSHSSLIVCVKIVIFHFVFWYLNRGANIREVKKILRKEAENLKRFDSKNVVRLWGLCEEKGGLSLYLTEFESDIFA